MANDRRTRGDKIAEFFGSDQLVQVFRPLAEEVFRRGGSPEDLELIASSALLREALAKRIIGESHIKATLPRASKVHIQNVWIEENGYILFKVTSDGTTGPEWFSRLEQKGFRVSPWAKNVLCSPEFKPTSDITTEIAILPGTLWNDDEGITSVIRAEAAARKLLSPNAEAACLIREMFSDKELEAMGLLWIVVMHEPIKDSDGRPLLLRADRSGGGRWLSAYCDGPGRRWDRDDGFAFAVPSSRNEIPSAGQV